MCKEEFISLLQGDKELIDRNTLNDMISLMREDAEGPCELLTYIKKFYFFAVDITGRYVQHEIHNIAHVYEMNLDTRDNMGFKDYYPIYEVELSYNFLAYSLADCLHFVNLILDAPESTPEQRVKATSFAVTIFLRKGMYQELRPYVAKALQLLKNKKIPDNSRTYIFFDLLECYAQMGKSEEFYKIYNEAMSHSEVLIAFECSDIYITSYHQSLELRRLLNDAISMPDGITTEELCDRFKDLMENLITRNEIWIEDYCNLLLPVLKKIGNSLPINDVVSYCMKLVYGDSTPVDKINFFGYLIDDLHISEENYPEVYQSYRTALKIYFDDSKESSRIAVMNEYQHHLAELEMKKLSVTDELTRLGNRRAYNQAIEAQKNAENNSNLIILAIDVNGLKTTNDTFGHSAGDELLLATAEICRIIFSSIGSCFRLGGDEFTVLINTDKATFETALSRFDDALSDYQCSFGSGISVSYGHASMREFPYATLEDLGKIADNAMYAAKKQYYMTPGNDRRMR